MLSFGVDFIFLTSRSQNLLHSNLSSRLKCILFVVFPAKAGIQSFETALDPGFCRGDGVMNLKLMALCDYFSHETIK